MTSKAREQVKEFHTITGLPVRDIPTLGTGEDRRLRKSLLFEEVEELELALAERNLEKVADALGDILYVTYGAALTFGLDLDGIVDEIHESNLTKFGPSGEVYRNKIGKIMKGPKYRPPDLKKFVTVT